MASNNDPSPPSSQPNAGGGGSTPVAATTASTAPPSPKKAPPEDLPPVNGSGWGTVIVSVVLALVAGGAGGWAYQKYGPQPAAPEAASAADKSAASAKPAQPVASDELKDLREGLDSSRDRLKQLEDQVAALPKSQPSDDLRDLRAQIVDLRKASESVPSDEKRIDSLAARVETVEKNTSKTQSELEQIRAQIDVVRSRMDEARLHAAGSFASDTTATRDAMRLLPATDPDLDRGYLSEGARLMEQRKYADAFKVFHELQMTHPDDARVWYFSALARGFSTNDWRGETERLVEKGIEREREGTPNKTKIDSAFSILTKETGKDWLDAYRRRARPAN